MKILFDVEYYDNANNNNIKHIARITAINYGTKEVFDMRTDLDGIESFYKNMLNIPNDIKVSNNIIDDFIEFIKGSNEVYYYGNEDILKNIK